MAVNVFAKIADQEIKTTMSRTSANGANALVTETGSGSQKAHSTILKLVEPCNIRADRMTQYVPLGATECLQDGSTACIWRHPTRTGLVLKSPRTEPQDPSHIHKFRTEVGILKALDRHPRVVQYLGPLDASEPAKDLLFVEAANGDTQRYLDAHGDSISLLLRVKWCVQASAALAYCHERGVFHCDLRPENMLLDADLDLSFCDFGGSKNADYDGEGLPDFGFFDPRVDSLNVTTSTEIFGLGSSIYTILVGYLPHGPSILQTVKDRLGYADTFERLAMKGEFPITSQILGGDIIRDCWNRKIRSAEEAHQRLMKPYQFRLEMDERFVRERR